MWFTLFFTGLVAARDRLQIPAPVQRASSSGLGSLAEGLDYDLGKDVGLMRGHEVPPSVVQSVIQAADQGNRGIAYLTELAESFFEKGDLSGATLSNCGHIMHKLLHSFLSMLLLCAAFIAS